MSIRVPLSFVADQGKTDALYSLIEKRNEALRNNAEAALRKYQNKINELTGAPQDVKLEYVIDVDIRTGQSRQALKAVGTGIKEAREEGKKLKNELGSLSSLKGTVRELAQVRDGIKKIDESTGKVTQKWKLANAELKAAKINSAKASGDIVGLAKARFPIIDNVLKVGNAFTQVSFIVKGVIEVFGALNAALAPVVQRAKQVEALKLSFQGFGLSVSDSNEVLDSAKRVALTYGGSLSQIEKGFKRITPAILASGGSLEETEQVMAALTARQTTLGLNTEQSGRYMEAFAQVMGKGKLQSEELTQQFSELDGALRAQIADYLKAEEGIDDLDEAMKNGKVTARLFRKAFIAVSESMTNKLGGSIKEINYRMGEFNGQAKMNIQQIQNIGATLNTLTLESLAETFEPFIRSIQKVQVYFSQFMASVANSFPGLQDDVKQFFGFIGLTLELVVMGLLNLGQVILRVIFFVPELINKFYDWLQTLGPIKAALDAVGTALGWYEKFLRGTFDALNNLGEASVEAKAKFSQFGQRAQQLTQDMMQGKITSDEYKEAIAALKAEAEQAGGTDAIKVVNSAIAETKRIVKDLQDEYAEEVKSAEENYKIIEGITKQKIDDIKDIIATKKDELKKEKDNIKEAKEAIKERWNDEKEKIKEARQEINDYYDDQLAALDALTPAEQRLADARKKELQQKARSGQLSQQERDEAQASLDAITRRERRQQLLNEKKQKERQLDEQRNASDKKHKDLLEEQDALLDKIENKFETEIRKNEEAIKDLEKELDKAKDTLGELKTRYDNMPKTLDEAKRAFNDNATAANEASGKLDSVTISAEQVETAAKNATVEVSNLTSALNKLPSKNPSGILPSGRYAEKAGPAFASGGPVSGGGTYTVNELGKEAFLAASGRLSMINAPAFGQWRAPSSGVIIPAHLTSMLDIPSGGINIGNASANAMAGRVTNNNSIAKAIMGLSRGDSIQNNVTIQAANTTQAASDMLVSLTRIKRRRYG